MVVVNHYSHTDDISNYPFSLWLIITSSYQSHTLEVKLFNRALHEACVIVASLYICS